MKSRPYLMGIDNGGTVTKAALYDTAGTEIAVSSVKTEMLFPHPGHTEKDSDDLWAANARVIAEVMKKARIDPAEIAGLAVTGHGNGLYLVGPDGRPAHAGINSADSRAADYVARWYQDGTFEKILPRTCQSIWAAQPAALLAWFKDHEPGVLARTRWIFMCKDYIRYRLTGEACAEVTDYSGLNLMNVRDLRYDPVVLSAFGIADISDKLPPVRGSGEICGRVTRSAAAETGGEERKGLGCCPGIVRGTACVVRDPKHARLTAGCILVADHTDPGWIMLFPSASGLVVERGSLLSHSAIVARELGIPAVISIPGLLDWLQDGDEVELDGAAGIVRRIVPVAEEPNA
ncbi:MAG: FGGY family carbohydrate kinase [Spirochaetia bacterium]